MWYLPVDILREVVRFSHCLRTGTAGRGPGVGNAVAFLILQNIVCNIGARLTLGLIFQGVPVCSYVIFSSLLYGGPHGAFLGKTQETLNGKYDGGKD